MRAVRIARAIMTAPAMSPFQVSEIVPGADRTTDDEILDWVRNAAETTYHPVGTCKMGHDSMGSSTTSLVSPAWRGRASPMPRSCRHCKQLQADNSAASAQDTSRAKSVAS